MKSQLARFLTTGIFVTLLDFALYAVLMQLSLSPTVANYFSTTIALVVSFFINKNFTFRSEESNKVRRFALFLVVTLLGIWVIQPLVIVLVLPLTSSVLDSRLLSPLTAKVVATVFSTIWNYYLYKTVVFKKGPSS